MQSSKINDETLKMSISVIDHQQKGMKPWKGRL